MGQTIYIIGAGAIGMSLAVFLTNAGKHVILLHGRAGRNTDSTVSLTVESNGTTLSASIPLRSLDRLDRLDGLILLTTKTTGNADLAARLAGKTGKSPLVLMQNGLGVEEPFQNAAFPALYRCVLLATSQVVAPYTVLYKPVAASPVGIVTGDDQTLQTLIQQLTTVSFPFRAEAAIQAVVWEKVIANCVFNAICTLLETDNGLFHRSEAGLSLARDVISECVAVAALAGITLHARTVEDRLLQISQRSDGQLISTLVDVQQGRETEIEHLNLAVGRLADRSGKPELAVRTRLLGELVRMKATISRGILV
nr:2-dehydropantoate 2-reductase [uncultured Arsenicibacter sp.]